MNDKQKKTFNGILRRIARTRVVESAEVETDQTGIAIATIVTALYKNENELHWHCTLVVIGVKGGIRLEKVIY